MYLLVDFKVLVMSLKSNCPHKQQINEQVYIVIHEAYL